MKSENDELSRKISQQDKIIEILQTNYYSNAAGKENLEVKLHQKPSFPFPPQGFLIPQPGQQLLQVPQPHETVQHDDTKHSELSRDYSELENELKLFESGKLSLEKDLEIRRKMTEDAEKKIGEHEKDAAALKAQNNLKENNKDLEADTKKIKSDYLELSKKVATQFSEYQAKIKELGVEKTVIENRKLKKEEKSAKKKAKKEQKAGVSEIDTKVEQAEFRCDDREENDGVL